MAVVCMKYGVWREHTHAFSSILARVELVIDWDKIGYNGTYE
jgi:hypothetical protein